ncbi:MAG TPA: AMP-binding protein [Pantanalinema sp.]
MSRKDYPGARLLSQGAPQLGRLPERMAAAYADRTALVMRRGPELSRWTFDDLAARVNGMVARLEAEGVRAGDRVALMGDNSPEWILAFLAIVTLGAIAVPLDTQLTPEELARIFAHAEPTCAFVGARLLSTFPPGRTLIPLAPEEFLTQAAAFASPALPDDVAALLYTSGTSGNPKGVALTHRNLWADALGCAEVLYVKPEDVSLCLLPLHHAYSLTCALVALASGISLAFTPSLKPDSILKTLHDAKVTAIPAVPLVLDHLARGIEDRIAELPKTRQWIARGLIGLGRRLRPLLGAHVARWVCAPIVRPFGRLRGLIVGGAPLNPASAGFFHALGLTVLHGYGLTETSPVVALTPSPWRPGDGVGAPLRGVEVCIHDPADDGIGEIWVRGPNVMAGYFRNPEATAHALKDGWLRTGDLGRRDARGYLHILGRSKDIVVLPNGKNVYPDELEQHYGRGEAIAEICVVPAQGPDGAEYPLGVIVPDPAALDRLLGPGRSAEAVRDLLSEEIKRLSTGLADYKRLKRFEVQDAPLPRNNARKVLRHAVRSALEAARAHQAPR